VTVLTSLDDSDLKQIGYNTPISNLALIRAKRAMRCGCDGVIASGLEAKNIKNAAKEQNCTPFLVITPGIRPRGTSTDDHKRAVTPSAAISCGSDYLVVGRPIIKARNPRESATAILAEMQDAYDSIS